MLSRAGPSCELQPCSSSNIPKTSLIALLQPLPGDFRCNDITSRVTSGHFRSRDVISSPWLPPPASYSPVGAQTYPKIDLLAFYSRFQVTSDLMTPLPGHLQSLPVTLSFPVSWLLPPASYSPVGAQTYPKLDLEAFYSHFQVTPGQ